MSENGRMARSLSIAAALIVFGAAPLLAVMPKPKVYFQAPAQETSELKVVRGSIGDFTKNHKEQLEFVGKDSASRADFGYADFYMDKQDLQLKARFTASKTTSKISTAHRGPQEHVSRLFLELVEITLFDDLKGAYRPLAIERCSAKPPLFVEIAIKPVDGVPQLDSGVTYYWGEWNAAANTYNVSTIELTPVSVPSGVNGEFKTWSPSSEAFSSFQSQCRRKNCRGVLVPRLRARGSSGVLNDSVPSTN
jgi:hypothetical protein